MLELLGLWFTSGIQSGGGGGVEEKEERETEEAKDEKQPQEWSE